MRKIDSATARNLICLRLKVDVCYKLIPNLDIRQVYRYYFILNSTDFSFPFLQVPIKSHFSFNSHCFLESQSPLQLSASSPVFSDPSKLKQYAPHDPPAEYLKYNPKGQVTNLRNTEWQYDHNGATVKKLVSALYGTGGRQTRYHYGMSTRLDKAIMPSGDEITYSYPDGKGFKTQNPVRKYKNSRLSAQYEWHDPTKLSVCKDYEQKMLFLFAYDRNQHLSK